MLSQIVEARHALRLFRETPEGFGYLLKDRVVELDDFLDAVHRVGRGGTAIDPEVVAQLLGRRPEDDPLAELTPREREVLGLMAEGRSNKAICAKLFLSPKTIETHVNSIFVSSACSRAGRPPARARRARVPARHAGLRRPSRSAGLRNARAGRRRRRASSRARARMYQPVARAL